MWVNTSDNEEETKSKQGSGRWRRGIQREMSFHFTTGVIQVLAEGW